MSYVIDRRLNSKNKSSVNRQRFLERHRKHVQRAVRDAIDRRSIQDMERGEEVSIPAEDLNEPQFQHGQGGRRGAVHPGNKEFVAGDRLKRPDGGGAGAGGQASNSGEGEDNFAFEISSEEFLNYLFEDLELPNLTKRHLAGNDSFRYENAGFSSDGVPAKLSIARTFRAGKARRIALTGVARKRLAIAEQELADALARSDELGERRWQEEIKRLKRRLSCVPFLDNNDLRYNLHVKKPVPSSRAVMFCLMDVSGSMDQETKDVAKRFFLLLYLFLKRSYEKTEVVFIRHHTTAKEVDEQEFFYSRETGGTVVSSALRLMAEIIEERYARDGWNIYGAQASDGDNWNDDSPICSSLLEETLLPAVQHFAYVEITRRNPQALWHAYESLAQQRPDAFAIRRLTQASEIYPVFRDLFARQQARAL
ncbi:MAG: YeaH/YhbH family protein [Pseudomonadaceae bacterium]|nr:YeaH/YhbH family protein [Pseudomonadaceae bacterium]